MNAPNKYQLKRDDILQIVEGGWLDSVESFDLSLVSDDAFEQIKKICDALQTPSELSKLPFTASSTIYIVRAGGKNDDTEAFQTIYPPQRGVSQAILDLYDLAQPVISESEDPRLRLISGGNAKNNRSPS